MNRRSMILGTLGVVVGGMPGNLLGGMFGARRPPFVIGRVLNVYADPHDASQLLFALNASPISAVHAVYDCGLPVGFIEVDLARGMFRLKRPPAGIVTADVVAGDRAVQCIMYDHDLAGAVSARRRGELRAAGLLYRDSDEHMQAIRDQRKT